MSEQSERYDAPPEAASEVGREQPQKNLSPAGMSAMRGDSAGGATVDEPPAVPPEVPHEPPTSPASDADRDPAAFPDQTRLEPLPPASDARSTPPDVSGNRSDPSLNDFYRPEPVISSREPVRLEPEPSLMQDSSPARKQAESVPETAPRDASDTPTGPREDYRLPDGRPTQITGDLHRFKDLNHPQGEVNDYQGTCGICAAQCVANEHGIPVSEADVLKKAADNEPPLCETDPSLAPEHRGGTTPETRAELLTNLGVPSHVETGKNFEDLSRYIDDGKSVILSTNAGYLWNDPYYAGEDPTKSNHAVTLIDVAHDPQTDDIQGFYINDSGGYDEGRGSGRFIGLNTMRNAWLNTGGKVVVSDNPHR